MNKAWQKYLDTAGGLTNLTRQRAESVVRSLVKQGEIAADRGEKAVDELLQRSEENRKAVAALVKSETERAIGRLGLARKREVDQLQRQVRRLESELSATKRTTGASSAQKSAKKSTKKAAKKSPKKTAKKSTKKATKRSPKKTAKKS